MVLLYMVTWIPSIYPLYVSIYTSTMDPSWDWGFHIAMHPTVLRLGSLGHMKSATETSIVRWVSSPSREQMDHIYIYVCIYNYIVVYIRPSGHLGTHPVGFPGIELLVVSELYPHKMSPVYMYTYRMGIIKCRLHIQNILYIIYII